MRRCKQPIPPSVSVLLGAGQSGGLFAEFHFSEGGVVPASWGPGYMPTSSTAPQRMAKGNRPIGQPGPMGLGASCPGQRRSCIGQTPTSLLHWTTGCLLPSFLSGVFPYFVLLTDGKAWVRRVSQCSPTKSPWCFSDRSVISSNIKE